jgi:hypothetical protein
MVAIRPRIDRTIVKPPLNSKSHVSDVDPNNGSEFGGVAGLIQPDPHQLTPSETLMQMYAIDPADDGSEPDSVTAPPL